MKTKHALLLLLTGCTCLAAYHLDNVFHRAAALSPRSLTDPLWIFLCCLARLHERVMELPLVLKVLLVVAGLAAILVFLHWLKPQWGSSLHHAAHRGDLVTARLLLLAGANANEKDIDGTSPLHLASLQGNYEVAALLVEKGADVNATDCHLMTPLHFAASLRTDYRTNVPPESQPHQLKNKVKTAMLLIEKGADMTCRDENHQTALELAVSRGFADMEAMLREYGAH
ncbi:MAG: ankyrin repeat domain-containing protein [Candidatus Eremiobacteraeota bacterium]|nr:ankyrin repeat domain-containing protein [Candidatus Eremiobacteraeota bacterium]